MTTQDSLRLQRAESLMASLTGDLATERERLRVAREAIEKMRDWSSKSLDLVTCAKGPWDQNVYQESIRALAQLLAPVQAEQKEWQWRLADGGSTQRTISSDVSDSEAEIDAALAVLMEYNPNGGFKKQWRTKAGEWQDAEAKETA